ncbi:MAG: hypothetical protein CM15mP65_05440 [Crocinitomicaceae bacterium]|nr:MAG: hypothetical protein CM15mP65_05440 [Crocinitomicaceae bacterium]
MVFLKGTATFPNFGKCSKGGCNLLFLLLGKNYYVDDIGFSGVAADASVPKNGNVVTVVDCSNITELTKREKKGKKNPNPKNFSS